LATKKYLQDVAYEVSLNKVKTGNNLKAIQVVADAEAKAAQRIAAEKQSLLREELDYEAQKAAGIISEEQFAEKMLELKQKRTELAKKERDYTIEAIKEAQQENKPGAKDKELKKLIKEQEKADKEAQKRKAAYAAKDEEKVKKRAIAEQAYKDKLAEKSEQKNKFNAHVQGIQDELFGAGKSPEERLHALKNLGADPDTGEFSGKALFNNMTAMLSNFAQMLDSKIENIGSVKSIVDTALQGSNMGTGGLFKIGSSY